MTVFPALSYYLGWSLQGLCRTLKPVPNLQYPRMCASMIHRSRTPPSSIELASHNSRSSSRMTCGSTEAHAMNLAVNATSHSTKTFWCPSPCRHVCTGATCALFSLTYNVAVALFRALLHRSRAASINDEAKSAIQNVIRRRFKNNSHVQSRTILSAAFQAGYEVITYSTLHIYPIR